jgi:hypothetical protein
MPAGGTGIRVSGHLTDDELRGVKPVLGDAVVGRLTLAGLVNR